MFALSVPPYHSLLNMTLFLAQLDFERGDPKNGFLSQALLAYHLRIQLAQESRTPAQSVQKQCQPAAYASWGLQTTNSGLQRKLMLRLSVWTLSGTQSSP